MGRLAALVLVVATLMSPVIRFMAPLSSTVVHELTAKSASRIPAASRTPAIATDTTVRYRVTLAVARVAALDGVLSLPVFTADLFVPPRA
jgi:hypothetical protein